MCGSVLESESKKKSEEEPKNGSRVRQHTTLGTESEVVQAIEQIREEAPPPAQATVPEEEDPLSQYLEDFDDENDDDDEELEDILGLSEEEDSAEEEADEQSEEEEIEEEETVEEIQETAEPEEIVEEAPPPPPVKKIAPPRKTGLTSKAKEMKPEPKPEPKRQERAMQQPKPATPKRKGISAPGRLFGWFVSFASPEGAAVELREGRFFVTSSNVRGTDLVLNDDSVSAPHALVVVESGLVVQDLVSESGVFVKRAGSSNFKQEIDPVELFHGDSVRFGNVEFIVSLLPDVDS
jgi:cell division septation protein DedD